MQRYTIKPNKLTLERFRAGQCCYDSCDDCPSYYHDGCIVRLTFKAREVWKQ